MRTFSWFFTTTLQRRSLLHAEMLRGALSSENPREPPIPKTPINSRLRGYKSTKTWPASSWCIDSLRCCTYVLDPAVARHAYQELSSFCFSFCFIAVDDHVRTQNSRWWSGASLNMISALRICTPSRWDDGVFHFSHLQRPRIRIPLHNQRHPGLSVLAERLVLNTILYSVWKLKTPTSA